MKFLKRKVDTNSDIDAKYVILYSESTTIIRYSGIIDYYNHRFHEDALECWIIPTEKEIEQIKIQLL